MRQRLPLLNHEVNDETDGKREDGEVVALAPEAQRADRVAEDGTERDARRQAGPERHTAFSAQQPDDVRADAEKRRVRQRELAREPEVMFSPHAAMAQM